MNKILLILCLVPLISMGQDLNYSDDEKAFWVNGYFKEMQNSYIEVVSAFDYDLEGARSKAANEVMKRRSLATGTEAKVSIIGKELNVVSEHNLIVKSRIIDEYVIHTEKGYTVYLLVQTAKNPEYQYESISISDEYKVGARAFIPGMAQIYKGSKFKGYTLIATQALSVAGIILCENQRAIYHNKSIEQPKFAQIYSSKASNWETGRNISIGVAVGIWIYNIVDAYVAKGKKRIVQSNDDLAKLNIIPQITTEMKGVTFAYNF